jgi:hypothetical protein
MMSAECGLAGLPCAGASRRAPTVTAGCVASLAAGGALVESGHLAELFPPIVVAVVGGTGDTATRPALEREEQPWTMAA